ncbi:hypothetical protein J6590_097894 [Homalodisca vitripennis]|nr:hypothetical protein J6590_097894 [Homalodisca vitripennis]
MFYSGLEIGWNSWMQLKGVYFASAPDGRVELQHTDVLGFGRGRNRPNLTVRVCVGGGEGGPTSQLGETLSHSNLKRGRAVTDLPLLYDGYEMETNSIDANRPLAVHGRQIRLDSICLRRIFWVLKIRPSQKFFGHSFWGGVVGGGYIAHRNQQSSSDFFIFDDGRIVEGKAFFPDNCHRKVKQQNSNTLRFEICNLISSSDRPLCRISETISTVPSNTIRLWSTWKQYSCTVHTPSGDTWGRPPPIIGHLCRPRPSPLALIACHYPPDSSPRPYKVTRLLAALSVQLLRVVLPGEP